MDEGTTDLSWLYEALKEMNMKLCITNTRQIALERLFKYYYHGAGDKLLALWTEELNNAGLEEFAKSLTESKHE